FRSHKKTNSSTREFSDLSTKSSDETISKFSDDELSNDDDSSDESFYEVRDSISEEITSPNERLMIDEANQIEQLSGLLRKSSPTRTPSPTKNKFISSPSPPTTVIRNTIATEKSPNVIKDDIFDEWLGNSRMDSYESLKKRIQ